MGNSFQPTWGSDTGTTGTEDVGFNDVPLDNITYVRLNQQWVELTADVEDVLTPDDYFVRRLGGWVPLSDVVEVGEAPDDGDIYIRQNGQWVPLDLATVTDVMEATSETKIVTPKSLDGLLDRLDITYDGTDDEFYVEGGFIS